MLNKLNSSDRTLLSPHAHQFDECVNWMQDAPCSTLLYDRNFPCNGTAILGKLQTTPAVYKSAWQKLTSACALTFSHVA